MTPLIDRVEQAFIAGREQWRIEDAVDTAPLLQALAIYGLDDRDGECEGACLRAFLLMREKHGADWVWLSGDVAEAICFELLFKAPVAT